MWAAALCGGTDPAVILLHAAQGSGGDLLSPGSIRAEDAQGWEGASHGACCTRNNDDFDLGLALGQAKSRP